jgi:hypothetical protein
MPIPTKTTIKDNPITKERENRAIKLFQNGDKYYVNIYEGDIYYQIEHEFFSNAYKFFKSKYRWVRGDSLLKRGTK